MKTARRMRFATWTALAVCLVHTASAGDVFEDADWICPASFARATNATIEVRCPFVAKADGTAELAVSADAVYAVRLNGRTLVASARLPDVPPVRFYDVWKVEGVRAGTNELAFSLYSPGVGFSRFLVGNPGLRFRLAGCGCRATSSDTAEWRPSTADLREGVERCQLGFSFGYDATAKPAPWRRLTAADVPRTDASMTWKRRPFAPPAVLPFVAAKLVAKGVLDSSPADVDAARGMDAAKLALRHAGERTCEEDYGQGLHFLYDLGREEAGHLEIELEANEGTVVDIGHAEHAENGRIRALVGTRHFAGRYRAKDGRQVFFRWQYRMAGRYIQVHVRGAKPGFALRRVGIRPVLRTDAVPRPVPTGLNARQAEIWKTSVRTLQLSMHEHYEDCPWREQSLYANDSRNQILCGRFAFGNDAAYALHSLDLLAMGLGDDGWIELCMPARQGITIPSFTFSWNLALADCLRLYGPMPELGSLLPTAKRILDQHLAEMKDGLLPRVRNSRNWHFYDWADGLDGDWDWSAGNGQPGDKATSGPSFDAPLNMLFLLALEADADIAEKFGDGASAVRWRTAAAKLRTRIREFFWNEAAHRFDTYHGRDVKFNGHELTQALAILADVVPDGKLEALAEKLSAPSDWVETTLSQSLHKFEALAKVGPVYGRRARRTMETTWGAMLDAGATSFWETKEGWRAFGEAGSLCHGWSAVPVYFYSEHPDLLQPDPTSGRPSAEPAESFGPLDPSARPVSREYIWPDGRMPDVQPHQIAAKTAERDAPGFRADDFRRPYLEWYEPSPTNRIDLCMLVVSGGGFYSCCDAERLQPVIDRFVAMGATVASLTYRTPRPRGMPIYQSGWEDVQRAMRVVRSQAACRGFSSEKIGAIGISAGTKLVLLLATSSETPAYAPVDELDHLSCNLLFALPTAPAYVLSDGADDENARAGDAVDVKLVPELKFDAKTCPMCIFQGGADVYSPNGSVQVYRRLRQMKIPAELHLFADRTHGYQGNLNKGDEGCAYDHWFDRAAEFIRQMNYDGRLGPEVDLMSRYPSDEASASCIREDVWPAGKMPDVQTNQCVPYLEWHLPKELKTTAIQIIYSGGSYVGNSPDGFEVAPARRFLNGRGMTVVTLKYRTPRPLGGLAKHTTAWQDLQRTIRIVRSEAVGRGLDPDRIGIMGSSAGGHLTLMGATSSLHRSYRPVDALDRLPCNVQWAVAIYPAYALTDGLERPNADGGNGEGVRLAPEFSFDLATCPVLFVHGDADGWAAMNSVRTWEQLRRMGIQGDLHTLATRKHCFQRTASPGTGSYTWLGRIREFMNHLGVFTH